MRSQKRHDLQSALLPHLHDEVAAKCHAALDDHESVIDAGLPDRPMPIREALDIYKMRLEGNEQNPRYEGFVRAVDALQAYGGSAIHLHEVDMGEQIYVLFMDETDSGLLAVMAIHKRIDG